MKKKNSLDITSIVMIIVFAVLIVGGMAGMVVSMLTRTNGMNEDTVSQVNLEETAAVEKYETYEELADRFFEICKTGDIDSLYGLYYNDSLTLRQEKSNVSKEVFDNNLKSYMVEIMYFDEYPYGSSELMDIKSPKDYVNELNFLSCQEAYPFNNVNIQDCVALHGYLPDGTPIDFILAKIDNLWYMAV